MSVTATVNGFISLVDSITGTGQLTKLFSGLATTGTVSEFSQSLNLASGVNTISLPITLVQFLYLKNTHATNTVIVTWTPNGGASNVVLTLQPGASIMFTETNGTSGISALSLNASGSSTTIEMILVG